MESPLSLRVRFTISYSNCNIYFLGFFRSVFASAVRHLSQSPQICVRRIRNDSLISDAGQDLSVLATYLTSRLCSVLYWSFPAMNQEYDSLRVCIRHVKHYYRRTDARLLRPFTSISVIYGYAR